MLKKILVEKFAEDWGSSQTSNFGNFFQYVPDELETGMGSRSKNFSARLPAHEPENEPEIPALGSAP